MNQTPREYGEAVELAALATASSDSAPSMAQDFDDEDLLQFVIGEAGELPAERKRQIVAAIANDPDVAHLVAVLRDRLVEPAFEEQGPFRLHGSSSWMSHGWKIAATVALMLGVWRFAAPLDAPTDPDPPITRGPVVTQPETGPSGLAISRDVALVVSVGVAVGFLVPVWRRRRLAKK